MANKALAISEGADTAPIYPTRFTISTEDYALSRRLYLYTPTSASQSAKDFAQFAISDQGQALVEQAARIGLPLVEDNPYGELWFDQPPPAPLTARHPDGCLYLGSFSKVLAPGLRLGYLVAPKAIFPKLLQAKQAADLHTPGFNQRLAFEVLQDGFLERHVPAVRALYQRQCRAMLDALSAEMADLGVHWNAPRGGMFLWLKLPDGLDATTLLPQAVARGVAYVPGAAFHAGQADPRTLRLSFVTATVDLFQRIAHGQQNAVLQRLIIGAQISVHCRRIRPLLIAARLVACLICCR